MTPCNGCQHLALSQPDKIKDECGIFGIYAPGEDVAHITYLALYGLQHRGQESAGIASFDKGEFHMKKDVGLVSEVFDGYDMNQLAGQIALGHVRYADRPGDKAANAQPLAFHHMWGRIAMANNGSLVNGEELRQKLSMSGVIFQTINDSEVMAHLLARNAQGSWEDCLTKMMVDAKGAYSLILMAEDRLIGLRDPKGIRPLCIGKLKGHYILSSESCAFSVIGAEYLRDVLPGEIVTIDKDGLHSIRPFNEQPSFCIFEYVYIARPDSDFNGHTVSQVRREFGRQLAREYPVDADIVIPVPDSGVACALGYAEESGIPYTLGLLKNRYIGRTFIQPTQKMREQSVQIKLSPVHGELEGKRVVMVDDSIVRGTTMRELVRLVKSAGAKEVHLVISSPQVKYGCYYGVATKKSQLIAVQKSEEEVRQFVEADGLHHLTLEGMLAATGQNPNDFCVACFNGDYPVPIPNLDE